MLMEVIQSIEICIEDRSELGLDHTWAHPRVSETHLQNFCLIPQYYANVSERTSRCVG
jgi:hypothetical protein